MEVMIGVDPHKASHHVFAVDDGEVELAQLSVRASREQVRRLLAWAEPFERRTWSLRVNMSLTCPRRWRRAHGCWGRVGRTRPTPTMPDPSR